jgi:two-component system, OmpR family, response regulator
MKKILVVDDTKNIRTLLTMCLEMDGYHVTTANDGKQALALLQSDQFMLAFLDIKLPELTGTEVLRRIREMGIQIPIIMMTAFATVRNAIECTKLGAVAYLQKPFTAEKVHNKMQEILANLPAVQKEIGFFITSAKQLLADGKIEESFQQLKSALAINPSCGETYQLLAQIYEAQGNGREAQRFKMIARQFDEKI